MLHACLSTDLNSLEDLLDSCDESLFRSVRYNPQRVLYQILPPPKHTGYNLRSCGHDLTLSVIPSEFMHKNFLCMSSILYAYVVYLASDNVSIKEFYYYYYTITTTTTTTTYCLII